MHYTGQTYRPTTEAYTPLLEITAGCSYNRCAFCTMYRGMKFQMSPEENIVADLKELRTINYKLERLFLLNGTPFILPPAKLLRNSCIIICRKSKRCVVTVRFAICVINRSTT